ncbi:MAG: hypothetical protein II968_03215 [Selenomonadaceae bacterium]|nr:hypothetical protein [Selenomonadaceae bacterium]
MKKTTVELVSSLIATVIKAGFLLALVFWLPGKIDEWLLTCGDTRTVCTLLNIALVLLYLIFLNVVNCKLLIQDFLR